MVRADGTSDKNWVIWEFLQSIKQPNLPVNLFIPADSSKKTVLLNGPITQNTYIEAADSVGGGGGNSRS